ncbi:MAG: Dabb family protein [Planctomycetes bacterium]|nr:Dabb family protein [Planctomycetota bacterium]
MLLHTVLFWLKPGLSAAEITEFEAGLRSLTAIPSVRYGFIGRPAATRRPVIDHSYSYKLVVGFDDLAGHDLYQDIPVHKDFIARCSRLWTRVQIYDADALA